MKCISLHQPWAQLMAEGVKKIETRHWATSYRGLLAIHAAKLWEANNADTLNLDPFKIAFGIAKHDDPFTWAEKFLVFGAIVCVVRLVNVVPTELGAMQDWQSEIPFGNFSRGRFGWVTSDLVKLKNPIPVVGRQGLWVLDDETVDQIAIQLPVNYPYL